MPAVGVCSVGDGFEEFFGELLVVGVEVVDGFEDEFEGVLGPRSSGSKTSVSALVWSASAMFLRTSRVGVLVPAS